MRGDIKEHKESTKRQGMWHNTEAHEIEHLIKKNVGTRRNEHNKNSRTGITKKFTELDDTRNSTLVLNKGTGLMEQRKTAGTERHIKQHRSWRNGKKYIYIFSASKAEIHGMEGRLTESGTLGKNALRPTALSRLLQTCFISHSTTHVTVDSSHCPILWIL